MIKDCSFDSIEEPNPVAEDILDISVSAETRAESVLPEFDFWKVGVIPLLDSLDFINQKANSSSETSWSSEVVGAMAEGFEEFVRGVVLVDGWVTIVFLSDFDVGLKTFGEHLLHFETVSFPDNNAEVGAVKVDIEEGGFLIGDEEFSNIGKAGIFIPLRDVLEVHP